MKYRLFTAVLMCILGTALALPEPAQAAASDGVRCPNGYETQYDIAQKIMRCERGTVLHRPTVCDPSSPALLVYRTAKGRDYCVSTADAVLPANAVPETEARRRPVLCGGENGDGLRWQIEHDALGDRDRCRAARSEWIYPSQQ